ncbi:MAG: signal peptidase I [Methanobacteriota archaeon]|nr:MAG: signal peptidase I [Euryarchaeota archaeon]
MQHEIMMVVMLVFYVFTGYCLMVIAQKTGHGDNGWWGFIPILNLLLMFQIAGKPLWWIILLLIPIVNLVIIILTYLAMAEARGKPAWMGLLCIIWIGFPILAFSD